MKAEAIKRAVSPSQFYRAELPNAPHWKTGASGWQSGGLCPFHRDNHAGSFRVNLDSGAFRCFSCGASGGDVLDFTKQRQGIGFLEAVARLSESWGVLA